MSPQESPTENKSFHLAQLSSEFASKTSGFPRLTNCTSAYARQKEFSHNDRMVRQRIAKKEDQIKKTRTEGGENDIKSEGRKAEQGGSAPKNVGTSNNTNPRTNQNDRNKQRRNAGKQRRNKDQRSITEVHPGERTAKKNSSTTKRSDQEDHRNTHRKEASNQQISRGERHNDQKRRRQRGA
eukprot:TRINITY_DN20990_c0_g1_i1.p1 TRINITY_DN20990_c0_g1~~TRINITY_DN20990_c0_g1_i1.p1  ORF type:complete len:182 (-),score=9.56 TRINITY_DN20990_c0_g1_i1:280-825(-)